MKLSPIVLKLRLSNTTFGDRISGSADLSLAMSATLLEEMAFVIPLKGTPTPNKTDNSINQVIDETFGVVVALKNDTSQGDKTGLTANDRLHDIRAEIWSSILGWTIPGQESVTSYAGESLLDLNRAWIWYQFEFSSKLRIDDDNGFDSGEDELPPFDKIYAEYMLSPNANLPWLGSLPIDDTEKTDMVQNVDLTVNLKAGGWGRGFGQGFKVKKS